MSDDTSKKTLADYLPYEYRKKDENGKDTDTLKFLKAFDRIMLVRDDKDEAIEGLEENIARQADYFHPDKTPAEFLPWLTQWVALSLRADISVEKQREFIAKIIPLYRMRGTKANMEELLRLFNDNRAVSISEHDTEPHFFNVLLDLENVKDGDSKEAYARAEQQAHSVIRLAKPAHTRYQLMPEIVTFRIGPYNSCSKKDPEDPDIKNCPIIVGENTRLGSAHWKKNT